MELVSVHRIVMPKKGDQPSTVIEPRQRFNADSNEAKRLLASGAARDPSAKAKAEKAAAHAPATRVYPHGKPEEKKDDSKADKANEKG